LNDSFCSLEFALDRLLPLPPFAFFCFLNLQGTPETEAAAAEANVIVV
jgi:hypothetical protein